MFQLVGILVVIFGVINLLRMSILLIGSDIYNLVFAIKSKNNSENNIPFISIIIPAFNEERNIIKCVSSIFSSDYPRNKFEIIVVNDGSVDDTPKKIQEFKSHNALNNLQLISQPNRGKAHALNNGIKNYAKGELVMCLDADSYLSQDALKRVFVYFENPKVVAVATNVKIAKNKGLLNLIQTYEYIVAHQMKRAQTLFNIEYIIGGIGSTFRKSYIEKIGLYDTNTITEDIDLTMKILQAGNKNAKVLYAADVITYTQSALTITDLIKQRSRWKWGRYQTFLKNKKMFFTKNANFTKGLTWIYLPFALWNDFAFLFEPLVLAFLVYIALAYHDPITILSSALVLTFYLSMNIIAESTISIRAKLQFLCLAPFMYIFFYILSYAEYIALIKSLIKMHTLPKSLETHNNSWNPIERSINISTSS